MHLLLVLFASFTVCSGMRRRGHPSDKASSSNSATVLITPTTLPEQLEPVKIRVSYADDENVPGHVLVIIGDYEFDLFRTGSRRRKFLFDNDDQLEASDKKKALPFKDDGLFVAPAKAEKVFFEMAERFWFEYDYNQANCLDYVFNFVNALFDGKGPKKEMWPDNFTYFDKDMFEEYDKNYQTCKALGLPCEERQPLSALDRLPIVLPEIPMIKIDLDLQKNCELEDYVLKLSIKNLTGDGTSKFVLQHCTGRFRDQAFSCKIGGINAKKTFITNFLLMDETKTNYIKPKNVCHSHQLVLNLINGKGFRLKNRKAV
ncbi:hypothetical protein niasHT_018102 [Heterodera trifolii]|uniref:Effector protein n=1 Tax=Heterodera trifolii TaxID=157864 RepID=A0ABD2KY88_9BILA